ncbi:hypothetical protein LXL04_029741 [Taraxacum kok-saghyz]
MGCKGFLECLLTLLGLAMVGYGVYLFIMYRNATDDMDAVPLNEGLIQLGRPMLMAVSLSSNNIFDNLPTAWFIYLFIGVGAIVFVISCFGCIGENFSRHSLSSCMPSRTFYAIFSIDASKPVHT